MPGWMRERLGARQVGAGCAAPAPQPGHGQGREMLRSPARRTGFPAAGQENIPSHCPRHVTGSPCAPLGTMSTPTLATKENKDGCLAFYAKLPPASLSSKAWHGQGRPPSWPLMSFPPWPLVGPGGGKSVAAPGKKKKKSQVKTNNCLWGRRREADAIEPFRAWCWFLPSARAGLGSQREPGQCLGRGRAQLCPERYPVGKGCPRGTRLMQEAVSHPAACPGRPQRPLLCQPR